MFIIFSLGFLVFTILFSLTKHFSSTKHHPTSHNPYSYPFIGCLISFYQNRRRLLEWYTELLSKSPTQTIVVHRLGARRTIVTANPLNVEHILKTHFANFPKGKPFTDLLGDLLGLGIFNVDGEMWTVQRKLASHEFSTKLLREFVLRVLEEEVEKRLIPLLEHAAKEEKVIDFQEMLRRFAFDVICRVSLGHDPLCLDLDRPVPPLVKAFDTASEISAARGMEPLYAVWMVKRALSLGSEKKLKEAVKTVHESIMEIIRNKKMNNGEDKDLLSSFLSSGHDEEVVRDMVISFIMAGRDTTSSAMTWLFYLLSKNENVRNNIIQEVNNIDLSDFESLKEMNYIKACLCESMRLYPPVSWDSKHAVAGDVLPDGTRVGKGDRVTYFPYGMGRMEELWGGDRFEFKPERWFEKSGSGMKMVSPYKYPVFQAGPRVCLGKEMAFIQMKYVVGSILRRFEIVPVYDEQPVFVPLLTGHMVGGFMVLVKRRNATW